MTRKEAVRKIVGDRPLRAREKGKAYAPANIALCKYWGKRDEELNLPVNSSLSISLGSLGATTEVVAGGDKDTFRLNGEHIEGPAPALARVSAFLDLLRPSPDVFYHVNSTSTIPVAAGLASSASGFAALALAMNDLYDLNLEGKSLSIIARLGSGSASRSIYHGFVEWQAGSRDDGMDSYATRLTDEWRELRLGMIKVSHGEKAVGSRAGMKIAKETSRLYRAWPEKAAEDLLSLKEAIHLKDFHLLGRTAESNALGMHATMMDSWPPILYWQPQSVEVMHQIWRLRSEGLPVYFTMDAGPNVKILFEENSRADVEAAFPEVTVVAPFLHP